jgi:hypothetical protein
LAHLAGTLDLPWTYDLSQLLLAAVHFVTAYIGSAAWKTPLIVLFDHAVTFPDVLIAVTVVQVVYGLPRR